MPSKLIKLENQLSALLPKKRLVRKAPAELIAAASKWSKQVWAEAEAIGPWPLTNEQITDGLQLAKKPVFVFGVHRSGTTLLRDMLDGHPELCVLPSEGTWYTNQEAKLKQLPEGAWTRDQGTEWLRRLANPINQAPYWLLGRSQEEGSRYVDFARHVMAWWDIVDHEPGTQWPHLAIVLAYASITGDLKADYWVDKTPTNERYLTRIQQEMPSAKIIHMVRHPLTTLASRKKMEPGVSLRSALIDLKTSFEVAIQQSECNNSAFLLLKYEDLCNNPQATVNQITSFLQINPSQTLLQPTVAGIPSKANSSFTNDTAAGQILKPAQLHYENLNKAKQQTISVYMGKLSARLRYPLTPVGFFKTKYLQLRYRLF